MKIALIVNGKINGRSIGDIELIADEEVVRGLTGHHYNSLARVVIPKSMENLPLKGVLTDVEAYWFKGEEIVKVKPLVQAWENSSNPGEYVLENPEDDRWDEVQILDPEYTEIKNFAPNINIQPDWLKYFEDKIEEAYNEMDKDVREAMFTVFGTYSTESATAYNSTWEKMSNSPSLFSDAGLTSRFDIPSANIEIDTLLNTPEIVKEYADAKLAEAQDYSIARMVRIEEFRNLRKEYLNKLNEL
jgi:hypothetical protein